MATEPSLTLYDNHNDNSIDGNLWTTAVRGNASISEESSTNMYLDAPGSGAGGDDDRASVYQDVAGGNGMRSEGWFSHGSTTSASEAWLGISTDSAFTYDSWNPEFATSGDFIAVKITGDDNVTLVSSGYTVITDNSPIATDGTAYEVKIYEGGDGYIYVYTENSSNNMVLLAKLQGQIKNGSFMRYAAGAADSGTREFNLHVSHSEDYADNPLTASLLQMLM